MKIRTHHKLKNVTYLKRKDGNIFEDLKNYVHNNERQKLHYENLLKESFRMLHFSSIPAPHKLRLPINSRELPIYIHKFSYKRENTLFDNWLRRTKHMSIKARRIRNSVRLSNKNIENERTFSTRGQLKKIIESLDEGSIITSNLIPESKTESSKKIEDVEHSYFQIIVNRIFNQIKLA